MTQNYQPFTDHLANINLSEKGHVGSFPGLSGDSILIVPGLKFASDGETRLDYKNISQFTKNASEEQQQALWQEVANKLSEELAKGDAPRWLNTEGTGVKYLHVRIDESNRFYSNYEEYKNFKE